MSSIGVIGAGSIGGTLARHLASRGHRVLVANSRGPESLAAFAAEIDATAASVRDAAHAGDIVIVSIPLPAVAALPRDLFADVPASVAVIDTCNYYPEIRDDAMAAIEAGVLDSQWVTQQLGRPVVKAFNNIAAHSLLTKGSPAGTAGRIALSAAGGSAAARGVVLRLIDEVGFDAVDAGGLEDSWRQQPGTPAYCRDLDAASLTRALAEAVPGRVVEYRAEAVAQVKSMLATRGLTRIPADRSSLRPPS